MFKKVRKLFGPAGKPDVQQPDDVLSELTDQQILAAWSTDTVAGRAIDIFRPPQPARPGMAVLFLHGHGEIRLTDNAVYSRLFARHGLYAFCPGGGRSWWLDIASPEFPPGTTPQRWLLDFVIPFIADHSGVQPPHIGLLGVSMGGQGAMQLAWNRPRDFPVVAALAPAVDFHQLWGSGIPLDEMFPDAETARQSTVVLNVHPLNWPRSLFFCCDPADAEWFDGCARLGMKLSSSGILHERDLETSRGGHSWEYFNHMADQAVSHLVRGLTQAHRGGQNQDVEPNGKRNSPPGS